MAIEPDRLADFAANYARHMTSIRGRRVQRLLRREFAGADHVLLLQDDAGRTAVLGLSDTGAAWCATDGRGPAVSVLKWRHGAQEALDVRFDLLKDSLPVLASMHVPLAAVGRTSRWRIAHGAVPPQAHASARLALRALA